MDSDGDNLVVSHRRDPYAPAAPAPFFEASQRLATTLPRQVCSQRAASTHHEDSKKANFFALRSIWSHLVVTSLAA